ncbi:MAG: NTP transferase domain-containing protein, partial [Acidobacteriota bacterium]
MRVTIVLPVKDPCQAKSRLAPLLSGSERSRLALAMFSDTARALEGPELPVVVVTGSGTIARLASRRGWRILWDAEQQSESGSVDLASGRLASEGVRSVLRLPADIPLVQPRDIRTLAESLEGPGSTVLTPSRDRWGTNAILRSPPGLYPSSFGHDSFR